MKKSLIFVALIFIFIFSLNLFSLAEFIPQNDLIRVGIFYKDSYADSTVQTVTLSCNSGFYLGSYNELSEFVPEDTYETNNIVIKCDGVGINIFSESENLIYTFQNNITLKPIDENDTVKINDRIYKGSFEFKSLSFGKLSLVVVTSLENYIKGVLPSEFYPSWNNECLKAGAIAARTYALKSIAGRHDDFDICNTTHCQSYKGLSNATDETNKAVDDTAGIVVTFNNDLALTVYHAISINSTESAANAWGSNPDLYPYLRSVDTSFVIDIFNSRGVFNSLVSKDEFCEYLKLPDISTLEYFKSDSGYINKLKILSTDGSSITANRSDSVRSILSKYVRSANFNISNAYKYSETNSQESSIKIITKNGEEEVQNSSYNIVTADGNKTVSSFIPSYYFQGIGNGHCVGLSQYTSQALALMGYSCGDILSLFYPETILMSLDELKAIQTEKETDLELISKN